jgi:hypothetical protein
MEGIAYPLIFDDSMRPMPENVCRRLLLKVIKLVGVMDKK